MYKILLFLVGVLNVSNYQSMLKISQSNMSQIHYNDVTMSTMVLQSPASRLFTQPFIQAQIIENTKAPRHWPLCGEFTVDRWIPRTNGQ